MFLLRKETLKKFCESKVLYKYQRRSVDYINMAGLNGYYRFRNTYDMYRFIGLGFTKFVKNNRKKAFSRKWKWPARGTEAHPNHIIEYRDTMSQVWDYINREEHTLQARNIVVPDIFVLVHGVPNMRVQVTDLNRYYEFLKEKVKRHVDWDAPESQSLYDSLG